MNTPSPCNTCVHLYYDALQKDNPDYTAECKLMLELGNLDCKEYKHWVWSPKRVLCKGK
jgi:hypothetical protein